MILVRILGYDTLIYVVYLSLSLLSFLIEHLMLRQLQIGHEVHRLALQSNLIQVIFYLVYLDLSLLDVFKDLLVLTLKKLVELTAITKFLLIGTCASSL